MRIKIEQFLRNFGIRNAAELLRPRLLNQSRLILPQQSVYHFHSSNTAVSGPTQHDSLFSRFQGKVFIEHVTKLEIIEGNPIRTTAIANTLVNDFRRNNRFFKPLRKDEAVRLNIQNIPIFNYSFLNRLYRYHANIKANYFRWANINHTFWNNVISVHDRFGWNQFIEIELPDKMPLYADFRRAERGLTREVLNTFNNDAKLNLLEILKFFGPNQKDSNLYQLLQSTEAGISREIIDKVNFVIRVRNSFFILNLGTVFDYRQDNEPIVSNEFFEDVSHLDDSEYVDLGLETFIDSYGIESHFKPDQLQLKLVSLLTTLVEFNNGGETQAAPEPEVVEDAPEDLNLDDSPIDDLDDDPTELDLETETPEAPPELDIEAPETPEDLLNESVPEKTVLTTIIDLDDIEVTYTPPPTSELEETTLIVEKDPLEKERDSTLTVDTESPKGVKVDYPEDDPYVSEVAQIAQSMVNVGSISPRTYETIVESAQKYLSLEDPFESGKTVAEAMEFKPEDLELPRDTHKVPVGVSDVSMQQSVHKALNKKYIEEVLPKDILRSIIATQKQGVVITDIKQELVEDALNRYRDFSITIRPIRGRQSTIRFRIPDIDADGRFLSNGVTYSQRTQVGDIPIRKVNPTTVALTSYYNKTFIRRSELATDNYDRWINRSLVNLSMTKDPSNDKFIVENLQLGEKDLSEFHLPRAYSLLARQFDGFDYKGYKFYFNYTNRLAYAEANKLEVEKLEGKNYVFCGHYRKNPLFVGKDESFYLYQDNEFKPLGSITDIVELELNKAPVEVANISIINKNVPVGLVLAFRKGLTNLLEELKVPYESHQRGTRIKLAKDEFTLVFMDEVLVFNRSNYEHMLILGGIRKYHRYIKNYSRWDFDRKDVYYRILEQAGLSTSYVREIDTLFSSWLDPITLDILKEMQAPLTFEGLIYKAIELLTTDWSPSEVDGHYMRYKGYERMAGQIYSTLTRTIKNFNARQGRGEQTISLNPYEIWSNITRDPTVAVVEDSNPVQNLREQEVVTFSGEGGRSNRTLVARTRVYHKNDLGVISEATVDSGSAGAIVYMSPDANLSNIRGMTKPYDPKADGATKILSTPALLSVGSENDDTKRILFTSSQHAQTIHAKGYTVNPLRTGYESVIAQRTSGIFASTASDKGEVVKVTKDVIDVKYADGKVVGYKLGKTHGTAAGVSYPYQLETNLKVGDKVEPGDNIVHNTSFFETDRYTKGQVNWKAGTLGRIAFMDNIDTLEDGSVISKRLADELVSSIAEIRTITFRFDQVVTDLVKVGAQVDIDSILCIIQDAEVAALSTDDEVSETLKKFSSNTPRAKYVGAISKIECYYHGDIEDMSDSVRELVTGFDNERIRQAKALGLKPTTGQDDGSLRISGSMLEPMHVALRIYLDRDLICGVGDKLVYFNQMKTVISNVMEGENYCEDGTPLDIQFAKNAVDARQVVSPILNSTTTMLLRKLSEHVVDLYRGKTNARAKS